MADKIIFPNAIDFVRVVNDNTTNNFLGGRSAFVMLPTLYQRAHAIVHETGEYPLTENIVAPDESTSKNRGIKVRIINSDG